MENTDDDDDHGLLLIPGDVLIQILVWLPVVSLLRFKSVCKSWRALLESSFFIHLHATTVTTTSNKFGTFIFQASPLCHTSYTTETRIFMLTSSRRSGGGGEVFEVEDLGTPPLYKTGTTRWRMVGSCNGLICSKLRRVVSLWNPVTRQFRLLPKASSLTLEERGWSYVRDVFGFGFDVKTKDYKVVQITTFSLQRKMEFRVQVYSLSSNSWRVLEEDIMISLFPNKQPFKGGLNMSNHGLYLNGNFFFKGTYKTENGMSRRPWVFSFDFTNEIFTLIMKHFPDDHAPPYSQLILTYFGADKIAFSSEGGGGGGGGGRDYVYDIWVLNNEEDDQEEEEEEEEKESYYNWTKLQHSIRISIGDVRSIIPKAISDDGEFALIETRCGGDWKLQLFNLVTKEEKTVVSSGIGMLRDSVYKPSLVSVIGAGNGNGTAAAAADNRVVIGGAI